MFDLKISVIECSFTYEILYFSVYQTESVIYIISSNDPKKTEDELEKYVSKEA